MIEYWDSWQGSYCWTREPLCLAVLSWVYSACRLQYVNFVSYIDWNFLYFDNTLQIYWYVFKVDLNPFKFLINVCLSNTYFQFANSLKEFEYLQTIHCNFLNGHCLKMFSILVKILAVHMNNVANRPIFAFL